MICENHKIERWEVTTIYNFGFMQSEVKTIYVGCKSCGQNIERRESKE
jgi:hypothetical protein